MQNKEVFEVQQDPLPLHTDTHMQENGCRILLRFSFLSCFSLTIGPNYTTMLLVDLYSSKENIHALVLVITDDQTDFSLKFHK